MFHMKRSGLIQYLGDALMTFNPTQYKYNKAIMHIEVFDDVGVDED